MTHQDEHGTWHGRNCTRAQDPIENHTDSQFGSYWCTATCTSCGRVRHHASHEHGTVDAA